MLHAPPVQQGSIALAQTVSLAQQGSTLQAAPAHVRLAQQELTGLESTPPLLAVGPALLASTLQVAPVHVCLAQQELTGLEVAPPLLAVGPALLASTLQETPVHVRLAQKELMVQRQA